EHPFDGSWGYQPTGLYAPTSRFGSPEDFALLVDACHRAGLSVILDWVPGHFPDDPHGLASFDGTGLYEHADPRQGKHLDWDTLIYNYGRTEVVNFLTSNALFWLDRYGVDGLRVDAVASMLYLDYSRPAGGWVPNRHGGRENLEAIEFLRRTNTLVFGRFPDATTMAEESTAWPQVSRPDRNALFWLDRYGVDGLRVDAVASMLYLDYSRPAGGWVPNRHGGRENLEAIEFLRRTNTLVFGRFPDATTMAEESTAWPQVSR